MIKRSDKQNLIRCYLGKHIGINIVQFSTFHRSESKLLTWQCDVNALLYTITTAHV